METKFILWGILFIILIIGIYKFIDCIKSTISISKWLDKQQKKVKKSEIFIDLLKERSLVYSIYQWIYEKIEFQTIIIKLKIVDIFSKDEFHPWLRMRDTSEMSLKQRKKYLNLLEKIRKKKHLLTL